MRSRIRRMFSRRPKGRPTVEIVDLSTWNGDGDDALTPIRRPDSLEPIAHPLPVTDPDQADLRLLVTQLIADMHARGCLDAGHARVLDNWIDEQLPGWLLAVDQQAGQRGRTAQRLKAVDGDNFRREALELLHLRQRQLTLDGAYRHWRDVLAGRADGSPPATTTTSEAAEALVLPELPSLRPMVFGRGEGADAQEEPPGPSFGPHIVSDPQADDENTAA